MATEQVIIQFLNDLLTFCRQITLPTSSPSANDLIVFVAFSALLLFAVFTAYWATMTVPEAVRNLSCALADRIRGEKITAMQLADDLAREKIKAERPTRPIYIFERAKKLVDISGNVTDEIKH